MSSPEGAGLLIYERVYKAEVGSLVDE